MEGRQTPRELPPALQPDCRRQRPSRRAEARSPSGKSEQFTLKDGTKQPFTLDATTRVRSAGKPKAISDIATGGRGLVLGLKNADGTFTAKFVRLVPAK